MTVTVKIGLGYEFEVKAGYDAVFDVLSDVPASIRHMPKVERLTELGDGVYQLEMKRVGTAQVHLQTVYASKYVSDRAKGSVKWTPVKGVGNALVGGSWKVADRKGKSTHCVLEIEGTVDVGLPALMRVVVEPVVASEFEKIVEQYIDNLVKRFGGEV